MPITRELNLVDNDMPLGSLIVLAMRLNQCSVKEAKRKLLDALGTDRVRRAIQEELYNTASH